MALNSGTTSFTITLIMTAHSIVVQTLVQWLRDKALDGYELVNPKRKVMM